jgi:hypothetical protein
MEPEDVLPSSKQLATGPYHESNYFSPHLSSSLNIYFNIILKAVPRLSGRPITAGTPMCARVSPCEIHSGQSGIGKDMILFLGFPCQYHSTVSLHTHTLCDGRKIGPFVAVVQRHMVTPHRHDEQ